MQPIEWIAIIGVSGALLLGIAGTCSLVYIAAGIAREERRRRGRSERKEAYLELLAAKARLDQVIPECKSAQRAEADGYPLTELQVHARSELVPAYRRFGERLEIAGAFADPATARTLVPLHRAVTTWMNAPPGELPDADRPDSWSVYIWSLAFVRAIRADLDLPDLDVDVNGYADAWVAPNLDVAVAEAPPRPARQRAAPRAEQTSGHDVE